MCRAISLIFFFNDTATTEIYTLSLHDALPIYDRAAPAQVVALGDDLPVGAGRARREHERVVELDAAVDGDGERRTGHCCALHYGFAPATILAKSSTLSGAPPTSAPSMSGCPSSSTALSGLTLP